MTILLGLLLAIPFYFCIGWCINKSIKLFGGETSSDRFRRLLNETREFLDETDKIVAEKANKEQRQ